MVRRARGTTSWWRRSLQGRVLVSTLVLSAVVTGIVGFLLHERVVGGLLQAKVNASLIEAGSETVAAQERLSAVSGTDFDAPTQLRRLTDSIIARGEVRGFSVVLLGPVRGDGVDLGGAGVRGTPGLLAESVPPRLRAAVREDATTAWTYTRIQYDSSTRQPTVPGVVAGSQVELPADAGTYALFYLFPMQEQQRTVNLIARALLVAGVLLLVLLGGLTFLVIRQVVTPVRLARRTAERLAAGRLEERMVVRGEDDLARLAGAFNQMAASLQTQIRELEELSQTQRRFVSDVSHELRTPLTTVRMASDVLHDSRAEFDPLTARSAELLQTELDRFERLLADLLEVSRFDARAASLDLHEVDLVELAVRVVDGTGPLAQRRDTHVRVHAREEPVMVELDAGRIERVVRNLVANAIDHAEGRPVDVRVAMDDHAVALAVRDHGVGLSEQDLPRVFNRFWRADPARDRATGGTGLGLSIALEDTKLHGGRLEVWGRPGAGAQFLLTLPRRAGDDPGDGPLPVVPRDVEEVV
ncbi:HAMP domain-containing histidine kinase [Nocardioidaceae bacterium]|nr:HAMP domain-containing histidine kinase [Nocardioidaceae bacterium]